MQPKNSHLYTLLTLLKEIYSYLATTFHHKVLQKILPPLPVTFTHPCHIPADWQHIWTDGSALHNGHPHCIASSAWASPCSLSQVYCLVSPRLSNNIAELCAALTALQAWPDCALHIHTDSAFILDLVHSSLLTMECNGWHSFPLFSSQSDNNLGFVVPALQVVMAYASFDISLHWLLFQALLYTICSHSG